jgi:hypothetical protein
MPVSSFVVPLVMGTTPQRKRVATALPQRSAFSDTFAGRFPGQHRKTPNFLSGMFSVFFYLSHTPSLKRLFSFLNGMKITC